MSKDGLLLVRNRSNIFHCDQPTGENTNMSNIAELIAQKEQIEQQIKELRKGQRQEAITKAREIIAAHDLSVDDVFTRAAKAPAGTRRKAAPKYLDPITGNTWTGRGRAPRWLDGKDASEFLIKKD